MDWFLYDIGLRHERVNKLTIFPEIIRKSVLMISGGVEIN